MRQHQLSADDTIRLTISDCVNKGAFGQAFYVACVALMSHGAAGSRWRPLKTHRKILQHDATWTPHSGGLRFSKYRCVFNVVGEVGLEPTKA